MQKFYSNGKLLLTGEYAVLDGALSLAIPTKYGQDLIVDKIEKPEIIWESFDHQNKLWFSCTFHFPNLDIISSNSKIAQTLQTILKEAKKLNPSFLRNNEGFHIKTNLGFSNSWGLGTSSTLINNISNWANINAYELLNNSFGGSGYDIACAEINSPILYQLQDKRPIIKIVNFNPDFKDHLYFVHLNKKQNSKEAIKKYHKNNDFTIVEEISHLSNKFLVAKSLIDFEKLMLQHENLISHIIKQKPIQQELFSDYFGQIKSLGAWGGDFILATGNKDTPKYFKEKGFKTVIRYPEMTL